MNDNDQRSDESSKADSGSSGSFRRRTILGSTAGAVAAYVMGVSSAADANQNESDDDSSTASPDWDRVNSLIDEMTVDEKIRIVHGGIAYTEGVQSEGVIATAKHYAANNQEQNRGGPGDEGLAVSANVSERSLRMALYCSGTNNVADYSEGVFVGYRWFDEQNIEPEFPFGYGLTYTNFEYGTTRITPSTTACRESVTVQTQ